MVYFDPWIPTLSLTKMPCWKPAWRRSRRCSPKCKRPTGGWKICLTHRATREVRQTLREAVARPVQPAAGRCRTGPGRARGGVRQKAEAALRGKGSDTPRKPRRNRGHLPPHLPRIERVIEPASTQWLPLERHWSGRQWRRGCGEMARIGEDVSERLDVIPAQFRVLVTRRPKYACRRCSQAVAQAHAPEHVVPGGLPTDLFIAVRHRARTDGATMAHHRLEVRRSSAVLPSGRDLQTAGDRSGSGYARQLG